MATQPTGRRYRRGWIGQARTIQMAFTAGRSSAVWLMQISLTWCRRRSSNPYWGTAARAKQELGVTMVFRRNRDGWHIVHRQADSRTCLAATVTFIARRLLRGLGEHRGAHQRHQGRAKWPGGAGIQG